MEKRISSIIKRDGKKEPYNESKIQAAIFKAAKAVDGVDEERARILAYKVNAYILEKGVGELEYADDSIEFYQVNIFKTASRKSLLKTNTQRQRKLIFYTESKEATSAMLPGL